MVSIPERLATLEAQVKSLQRTQWILVTAILAQVGIEVKTLMFAAFL